MGSVVLSIDAELGWGHHDLQSPPMDRVEAGRSGWVTLLDLLDTYRIPATWAVVGHLFLETCDRAHPTHPIGDSWFARERGEWSDRPELRFGPELIRAIETADVDHEIGSHTFSHVEFGDDETTPEIARAELVASLEAAESSPVSAEMASVVFPRNNVGHRDVIAEWGFTCYRGVVAGSDAPGASAFRKISQATVGTPPLVKPTVDEFGLVNVPASLYLYGFEGAARRVCQRLWDDPIISAARRGIDAATESDGIFHIWLHPNNLVTDADVERLRTILAYIAQRRSLSDLRVETMAGASKRVERQSDPLRMS